MCITGSMRCSKILQCKVADIMAVERDSGMISESGVYDSRARNLDGFANNNGNAVSINQIPRTFGSSFQTVIFKPLTGIFNQHQYIPLRFMPITIEMSLVDDRLEIIVLHFCKLYW